MKFNDSDRQKYLQTKLESPAWDFVDHLLNPLMPSNKQLNARELFALDECLNSSCASINLSLLKYLKQNAQDIHVFEELFPLEHDKHIKKFHHRTAFCRWLTSATNETMGQICSGNFILIKPFDEEKLLDWESNNQTQLYHSNLCTNYWLTAWHWASSYPLNTEIVFGLSKTLVDMLRKMDAEMILKFSHSSHASQFQLRHDSTLFKLLSHYKDAKTCAVLHLLQDARILQEEDEILALGYKTLNKSNSQLIYKTGSETDQKIESLKSHRKLEEIHELMNLGFSESEIAHNLHLSESEVKFLIRWEARDTMLSKLEQNQEMQEYICKFFMKQMSVFGIDALWSYKLLINRTSASIPLTRYLALQQFDNQSTVGLVDNHLQQKRRLPVSSTHKYLEFFACHKQRIAVALFLLLYTRIGSVNTMRFLDLRSLILATEKLKTFLDKSHYRQLGIRPIPPGKAMFIAMEWSEQRIALDYCPKCGSIFASPNFDESTTNLTNQAITTRLNRCPICRLLHYDKNFKSSKVASIIREILETNYQKHEED